MEVRKLNANDASMTITTRRSFSELVSRAAKERNSLVCVGLDPDLSRFPASVVAGRSPGAAILEFNKRIIDATAEFAAVFKPQFAMYMQYGPAGLEALLATRALIPDDIPVMLDCKIGDIASTTEAYARAFLDDAGFDAITVNPYMGSEGLMPVFDRTGKGVFLLCKTSNPGSGEIQNLELANGRPLFVDIATKVVAWNTTAAASLGLVVGATYPTELEHVRKAAPDLLILMPGIGSQAGDLAAALRSGLDANGAGLLVNSSRGIIYASHDNDFAHAAATAARSLRDQINAVRVLNLES